MCVFLFYYRFQKKKKKERALYWKPKSSHPSQKPCTRKTITGSVQRVFFFFSASFQLEGEKKSKYISYLDRKRFKFVWKSTPMATLTNAEEEKKKGKGLSTAIEKWSCKKKKAVEKEQAQYNSASKLIREKKKRETITRKEKQLDGLSLNQLLKKKNGICYEKKKKRALFLVIHNSEKKKREWSTFFPFFFCVCCFMSGLNLLWQAETKNSRAAWKTEWGATTKKTQIARNRKIIESR